MHLIEKGILNNSMSVFMHISCTTDNLQFKNTDYLGGKKVSRWRSLRSDNLQKAEQKQVREEEEGKGLWGEAELGKSELGVSSPVSSSDSPRCCGSHGDPGCRVTPRSPSFPPSWSIPTRRSLPLSRSTHLAQVWELLQWVEAPWAQMRRWALGSARLELEQSCSLLV